MDFLSAYRPKGSVPLRPSPPLESDVIFLGRDMFTRFLFLSVDNTVWKFAQFFGVYARFIITTYIITFHSMTDEFDLLDVFVIMLDFFFLIDFLSALIYRCKWPSKNTLPESLKTNFARLIWRNDFYNPRKTWMLLLDGISLLPVEIARFWVKVSLFFSLTGYCLNILRGYRVIAFYAENIDNIFLRRTVLLELILKFALSWLVISHVFTVFYYWFIKQTKSAVLDMGPKTISFDPDSSVSWYLVLFYVNQFSLGNIGFGDLPPASDAERVITIAMCIVGFGMLNGFLISALSNALAEKFRRVAMLRLRIRLMKAELTNRNVPVEVVQKLEKFYHSLWVSRKGVGSNSKILVSLPDSLHGRIFYDIFLPALNTSLLFKYVDEFSKRAIARTMETSLYMAGETILKRNEITSKMFYVRKGTIEIMSYQDDETQIVTFGAGSIFGQVALLLSLPAKSEIHAATFCEIHILHRRNLFSVLKDYPCTKEIIFNTHRNMLLNVLADKFAAEITVSENVLSRSMFYQVPLQASKIARNDICVVNKCPFIFEPDTIYLKLWDAGVAIIILVIIFYYPYCATFDRKYSRNTEPFVILADLILFLNLYLNFSKAFTKENVLFSSFRVVVTSQLRKITTYIDVVAIFPLHYFLKDNNRQKPVVMCLRCLKAYKIYFLFNKAESSVDMKMIPLLRLVKYILYFFFIIYIVGIMYYLEACYFDPCIPDSWYPGNEASRESDSPVWPSLYVAMLVTSGTGYGDVTPKNMRDVVFVILFCFCGVFLFIYLVSEYSASLSLYAEPKRNFMNMVERINAFLLSHKMLPSERIRVRQFLNLQWERSQGYEVEASGSIFNDTPLHLLYEISQYTKSKSFHKIPLFKEISDDILHCILSHSYRRLLPPHEVVIYAGEVCSSLTMVEEGFCEISYGKDASLKKVIGAGQDICTVELMLGLTSLINVRTLTHCTLLKVDRHHLIGGFKSNHIAFKELEKSIEEFKKTEIVQEVQKIKPVRLHLMVRPSVRKSLYRFHFIRKQGGSVDLMNPYLKLGLCQWIRFVLWRATILPYGKVLKVWELLRCFFAFWSAMLFPLICYYELQVPAFYYIGILLDMTAWVDLYFRVHVCYFNHLNVLVSHPLRTFSHYLKGSFIIDFIFCFPIDRIMFQHVYDARGYSVVTNLPINFFRVLRVGQIYRIPATITSLGVDALSTPGLFKVLLMMTAMTIIFLNFMASCLVLYCFNYEVDKFGHYQMIVAQEKLLRQFNKVQKKFNLTSEPFDIYFVNFYWVTETAVSLGYGDITAETTELMIFVIILIILSYLYLNYVTILIASYLTSINMNLTIYQKRMRHLIKFLKYENVEPMLRKHIVNHFEYVWEKEKGMKARNIFSNFSVALKNDVLLNLYEDTLKNIGAFLNAEQNIFRILSNHLDEVTFQSGAGIYKAGDILSEIFIVQQGEVTLVGEKEVETEVLSPSMIFGHLAPVERGIAKVSAVATKNVTVLTIKTILFYSLMEDLKGWTRENKEVEMKKLNESLNKSNDQIQGSPAKILGKDEKSLFYYWTFRFSKYILIFYVILSYFSMNEVSFNAAFQNYSVPLTFVLVPVEILFVFKIILGFSTGFLDDAGDFVSDRRLIRRRYMTLTGFYLDFFTVIPFEALSLAFNGEEQIFAASMFRMTKLLRVFNIRYFFNMKIDTLNVNMVLMKNVTVLVWTSTLLHQCTCLWYFISCHRRHCPDSKTWEIILNGDFHSHYISSLYFTVVALTTTGFGDVTPHTLLEFFAVDIFSLVGFFYTAIFIGQIISTVQKSLLDKTNYEYAVSALRMFLVVNDVPFETESSVLRYIASIWRNEKGQQIPELLKDAPPYMINEIKQTTYGHHINNNPVFESCNQYFRKCLMNQLQRTVFFAGDVVVDEGEVNRKMFFVHLGLVESSDMGDELPKKIYGKNTFFGLRQGVLHGEPYTMTYTARTLCNILSLELRHWEYLEEFYPEDVKHILEEAKNDKWR